MSLRRIDRRLGLVGTVVCVALCLMAPRLTLASEYHGRITFGGLPVPGATITATGNHRAECPCGELGVETAFA